MSGLRYLSVCSGIEAASVWADLGWHCAGVAEVEPFPCQVLAQRLGAGRPRYMPDPDADGISAKDAKARRNAIKAMDGRHMRWGNKLTNFGDFTQIREDDVGPIDLLVGGTPCQSFSIAGKRLGLDDPRGNLTLEFLALAKRLRARWICWENVPGVLSHDEGRTFGTFLGLLGECGFERWAYRVLDAQYVRVGKFPWAVPQRRRRVFVIGYSGAAAVHPRAVLFDRDSLRGNPAPRRETGQGTSVDVAPSLVSSGRGSERIGETRGQDPVVAVFGGGNRAGPVSQAATLTARGHKCDFEVETFVAHALRGEGFDASEDGTGRGTPLVPVPVAGTLCRDSFAGGAGGRPEGAAAGHFQPVQRPFSIMPMNSGKDYKARETDVAQPLMAGGPVGGNQGGDFVAFDCKGTEVQFTTDGSHPTLRSMGHSQSHQNAGGHAAVAHHWGVRRLTPRECERLQGFPDDWTAIEWRGRPAEKCPDGPRYKACGNSMARNVMLWLGERIAMAEEVAEPGRAAA